LDWVAQEDVLEHAGRRTGVAEGDGDGLIKAVNKADRLLPRLSGYMESHFTLMQFIYILILWI